MSLARRQRAPLSEPGRELVGRVTGFQPETDYFDICSSYVALHLFDVNGMGGVRNKAVDHMAIDRRLNGLAEKVSLHGHESKAEALREYLRRLRRLARSLGGGDSARMITGGSKVDREEAAQNVLSSVLLVLLELSESPITLRRGENLYAVPERLKESKTKPKSQEQINREIWMKILKEDPLVGDHWQLNTGSDQQDSDGSDFEDMDVNTRAVPNAKDAQLDLEGGTDSTKPVDDGSSLPSGALELWTGQSRQKLQSISNLGVFERHQYWRGKAIVSKKYAATPRIEELGLDIQRPSDLNSALQKSREFVLAQSTPVMDEADIIHEVLLMLQGHSTVIFTFKKGTLTAVYSTKVATSHMSQGALEAILQPFLESAGEISKLQMIVDTICSAPAKVYGKVIQAFASAMSSEILELKAFLADKQKEYQRFRKELPPNKNDHSCRFSTDVLSGLYDNVGKFELSGDSIGSSASNIDLFASEFWTDGCYVQSEIVERSNDGKNPDMSTVQIFPCFLSERSMNQMLYTGKAIRMVQALSASEATHQYPLSSSSSAATPLPPSVHPSENPIFATDYTNAFDVQWMMETELAKSIEEQYQSANSLLKSMLFTQSKLIWHLRGMAEFNFMMQGEVMHLFSTTIFEKMIKKRPWYDAYILGSTFNQTASLCDWRHAQFVRVRVNNQARKKSDRIHIMGLKVQDLDLIEFEYLLPWPLSGVIYSTENAKRMYSRITCLLFQVKTVKHAMEQATFLKSKPKPSPELSLFWKLRLRFLSTINDLWSYFMTTVLDTQIKKFQSEIEDQCDLDDIIKLSSKFIRLCYERCFLKERTLPLHRSLVTMLNLALKFSALFSTFIHEQERNVQNQQQPSNPHGGGAGVGAKAGKAISETTDYVSKSGRRVSFNNASEKQQQGVASRSHRWSQGIYGNYNTDSEDETLEDQVRDDEEEQGEEEELFSSETADKRRRGTRTFSLKDEGTSEGMDGDEDIGMDSSAAFKGRVKKQKIDSDLWRGTSRGQRWSHEGSYQEQLKAIEQEFSRCREFLAKSLRVVVNSNAVRGYANRNSSGAEAAGGMGSMGQSEGDSNYLDGRGGASRGSRGRGYGRGGGGGRGGKSYRAPSSQSSAASGAQQAYVATGDEGTYVEQRFDDVAFQDEVDEKLGFYKFQEGPDKLGWLINQHATLVRDEDWPTGRAAIDYYFIQDDGEMFKTTVKYSPYFYIASKVGHESDVEEYIRRKFETLVEKMTRVQKEDLDMPNHLLGNTRTFIKLVFRNVRDLLSVRKVVLPAAKENQSKMSALDTYAEVVSASLDMSLDPEPVSSSTRSAGDGLDYIVDIREYDVPYTIRVAIDKDIRIGLWYNVRVTHSDVEITRQLDRVARADPVVFAFDIETTKLPLKFPDAAIDSVMMISYMIDGQGFLITNREIVSQDIDDFEYTPKPEYEGLFTIFNEPNEQECLRRFFHHVQEVKPTVFVTYNGDFFDWPFVEARAKIHGIDMFHEIGVKKDDEDEYKSNTAVHMDAFRWVKRDSYLPMGSQGLKSVTKEKLGYNPMELDPEDMTRFASERPQTLAQYSVSDAVATYYLYMKYVHPFIFSLCNIIPMNPDEVLRKGSGTLCETLLMVEAYQGNIIMPNKHAESYNKMYDGHLLESETYVGGHVEALQAGVYRSDIPNHFSIVPETAQQLIDDLDAALKFSIEVEGHLSMDDVTNYEEVKAAITAPLADLRDRPNRTENPSIYHLDVAAMYPNIILTNRLQPDSIIDESTCAACDFNRVGKECDRRMTWSWRGEYFPAKKNEYNMIRNQLESERFPGKKTWDEPRTFHSLSEPEQAALITKRIAEYSRKVYRKTHETKVMEREAIVCQRENPFYVDTVKAFRDRRYEYKGLHKTWKGKTENAVKSGDLVEIENAKKMVVLYDSLQLAHKCILNSFYGYVMRKGARWYSMEMAGIVCLTGARIIQLARRLVEQMGRPLELDTDGIWCIFPQTFPENFTFKLKNGKKFPISYPCTMLNHLVHAKFTNNQYQVLKNPDEHEYETIEENSIFFEVDGPYHAMILPSSKEEDKLLKKRYAVFNKDGSIAELKGFEVKRRGELKMIKNFQSQLFKVFLEGSNLEECYAAVARVANQWLDVLYSKAVDLEENELFDLISENRSMSKSLEEYGAQKSTSISTAKRLGEFLGDQMVKDKGLNCKFIIAAQPAGSPVTERAIPVAIFSAEPAVMKFYLRKWLRDSSLQDFDIRSILDWQYYLERFGGVIQKLITIPAAMQKVTNPVPRVRHPDWLFKRVMALDDKFKQHRITDAFKPAEKRPYGGDGVMDLEDFGSSGRPSDAPTRPVVHKMTKSGKNKGSSSHQQEKSFEEQVLALELPEEMPDMLTDYHGFLAYQKIKWKRQKLERAQRKTLGQSRAKGPVGSLSGFIQKQSTNILTKFWQIIQIVETDIPGEFRLWVLIDKTLHSIRLSVPRIFYVNSRVEDASNETRMFPKQKMIRTLPRAHPCLHLYQFNMPESMYQRESKNLSSFFSHPDVEGVYETQLPLLSRAIINLSCICSVSNRAKRGLDEGFDLSDLKTENMDKMPYLQDDRALNYLYLYHATTDTRHLFALFSSVHSRVNVFVVDAPGQRGQMPNMSRSYESVKTEIDRMPAETRRANKAWDYPELLQFDIDYVSSEKEASRGLAKCLSKYQDERRGPTAVILHSPRTRQKLLENIGILGDFPLISMPCSKNTKPFQALAWQSNATKRMLAQFLTVGGWITEQVALARYANIPLCNIEQDSPIFVTDVWLARQLVRHDMLLWWSPSSKPDLGGREDDENVSGTEELQDPNINIPGQYETVCLEMDLLHLAVNTLLQSSLINELEGGTETALDASHTLDDYSSGKVSNVISFGTGTASSQAFAIIKHMVRSWAVDLAETRNMFAESMVGHFHRWLTNPGSKLYDPCMYALVHGLMKKVFFQLTAEFKRLGSRVILGNFNKMTIVTSKPSVGNAYAYCSWIIRHIQSKPLFLTIDLIPVNYWEQLIWMDCANYGGIICPNPEEVQEQDFSILQAQVHRRVRMEWNIQKYLPVALHPTFEDTINEFIVQVYAYRHGKHLATPKSNAATANQNGQQDDDAAGDTTNGSAVATKADKKNREVVAYKKKLIAHAISRKLLDAFPKILVQKRDSLKDPQLAVRFAFPRQPGSHLELTNPPLELIKSIAAILGIDSSIEREVRVMRKNLLDLIEIREFAPESAFQNPCESFVLRGVICSYCSYCQDLDFCRDQQLLPKINKNTGEVSLDPWKCPECKEEYDRDAIEESMVAIVERMTNQYQMQDLKCVKCRRVKPDFLGEWCECSGRFVTALGRVEYLRKMRVFENIAEFYGLVLLKEIVGWMLSN
ncbi:DNA polymerase epsilon catalytic subunit [Mortierella sp. AD094]|nr:DNA polymerase epsilon catalytic subunit [Mortierella sp. AD094]